MDSNQAAGAVFFDIRERTKDMELDFDIGIATKRNQGGHPYSLIDIADHRN